jgi:hypothetical protein
MVDAGERSPDEAQPPEKESNGVKGAKANTLITQQAIACYGKAALYPVCQAALDFLSLDAELRRKTEGVFPWGGRQRGASETLIEISLNRIKEAVFLRKVLAGLPGDRADDREAIEILLKAYETLAQFAGEFAREYAAADTIGRRAFRRVLKRWNAFANGARLTDSASRKLEILDFLHNKRTRAVLVKEGVEWQPPKGAEWQPTEQEISAYLETLADPLSNSEWRERLTAREIHSRLVNADFLKDQKGKERAQLHEIRRIARKLGIRLAEDKRGRKRKQSHRVNKKPKRRCGRPRTRPEVEFTGDIDRVLSELIQKSQGKARQPSYDQFLDIAEAN